MYNTYAVSGTQIPATTVSSVKTVSYPNVSCINLDTEPKRSPHNTTICSDTIKSDFGKIKGIEVLYFRAAQLERTIQGQNKFAALGPLQVLYFPQYDRFVLSLNSWKYPLLKRIPIVGSSAAHGIPVTYTLPTAGGFFSLVIPKVEHLDALYNLEAILDHGAKLTFSDSEDVLSHSHQVLGNNHSVLGQHTVQPHSNFLQPPSNFSMNGNMMQGSTYSPRYSTGMVGQSFNQNFQSTVSEPTMTAPKKQSRWKRILFGAEYGRDKGNRTGSSKHNLNMIQKRDINSIKMTSEVMAAAIYYPRKEVERWIIYNKEMANLMNFSPELQDQDFDAFGHSSFNRSVDIDPTLPCNQPITSDRPVESITYQVGRNFTTSVRHDGKRTDGYIHSHSHSIHPDISGRFNNLSQSQFEPERFKNMSNTDPLYEATGISPINKIEHPYSFTQDDVLEDTRPSITERIKGAITSTNETKHFEPLRQEDRLMSFADKVEVIQPTTVTSTVVGESTFKTPTIIENSIPTHNIVTENLQPSTQYVSTSLPTTTLPTLQERIRNSTNVERPGLITRIKENVTGTHSTEHPYDLAQTHYAA